MQKIARTFIPVNRSCDRLESACGEQSKKSAGFQALAGANARLNALRDQATRSKTGANSRTESSDVSLPTHLGWGSERLLHSVGAYKGRGEPETQLSLSKTENTSFSILKTTSAEPTNQLSTTTTLHPELTTAFLKHELSATSRIWLLLRHIDVDGRGWVTIDEARQQLTTKGSALRVCGWRQLRNLLRAGNGTFWKRDKQRIWLRSVTKVATQLQVERLSRPLAIPTEALIANIQTVRATFYAVGHSNRNGNPISRAKLAEVTGINERTQRRYDRAVDVQKTANYCLGDPEGEHQEQAWHQRHATFDFVDKLGKHGQAGKRYRAFQLPNSYSVQYQAAANGRTRKINQQLRQDLVKNRAQGNGRVQIEEKRIFGLRSAQPSCRKLFFDSGLEASKQGDSYLKTQANPHQAFWTHFA